jgi:hypothetical protein
MAQVVSNRHSELFPVALFLGAAWIFVLNKVVSLTGYDFVDVQVPCLVYVHNILTFYFVVGVYILYRAGVLSVSVGVKESNFDHRLKIFFFETWFIAFVSCIFSVVVSSSFGDKIQYYFIAYVIVYSMFSYLLSGRDKIYTLNSFLSHGAIVVVLAMACTPIMISYFSDVEIATDKKVYTASDDILVSITPTGYAYTPEIIKITYGTDITLYDGANSKSIFPGVVKIRSNWTKGRSSMLVVEYVYLPFVAKRHKTVRLSVERI